MITTASQGVENRQKEVDKNINKNENKNKNKKRKKNIKSEEIKRL